MNYNIETALIHGGIGEDETTGAVNVPILEDLDNAIKLSEVR